MVERPLISIVVATRNRTDLLQRALESIAAQDFSDYEAVVVDDGSDEHVFAHHEQLVAGLPGNFALHRLRPPGSAGAGPSAARNQGIARTQGEFLAFLDDDDYWIRPDHLKVAAEQVQRHNADFYFANMQGFRYGKLVQSDWFPDSPELTAGPRVHSDPDVYLVSLGRFLRVMRRRFSHPDCWIVRKDLVTTAGGFWEQIRFSEDYNLMMRIADRAACILYRPECVTAYRFPEGNSVSLTNTRVEEHLQLVSSTLHVGVSCRRRAVRNCARIRQSWHLRQIGSVLLEDQKPLSSLSFMRQAVCTYPTMGGVAALARSAWAAARQAVHSAGKRTD